MKTSLVVLGIVLALGLSSCAGSRLCRTNSPEGNLGSTINSTSDDIAPQVLRTSLLFSSTRSLTDQQIEMLHGDRHEAVFRADKRSDASYAPAEVEVELPLNAYQAGSPALVMHSDSEGILVFPRSNGQGKDAQVDLYESDYAHGQWSAPVLITATQSKYWDSQPCLSPDGSLLIFVSDRPGGSGGMDLWYCHRTLFGWTEPQNLGSGINTKADEMTPSVDVRGNLLFASNRTQPKSHRGFELFRAESGDGASWMPAEILPSPINSAADDIYPVVNGDTIYFASKRAGGCGGYDLYAMQLCGPVIVRGQVQPSEHLSRRSGIITLLDTIDHLPPVPVPEDGHFEFRVWPNHHYLLRYLNECSDSVLEQDFVTPCHETKAVVLQTTLKLPDRRDALSTDEFKVPFYSPGYYLPNTTQELNDLRLKFSYNYLGTDKRTMYISVPPSSLDSAAPIVDSAMDRIREFVLRKLDYRKRGCITSSIALHVSVYGYSDGKNFAEGTEYRGPDIDDAQLDVHVKQGTPMSNTLFATLRAYYMVKVLQNRLSPNPLYEEFKDHVLWTLIPRGSIDDSPEDAILRKVDVKAE